MDNAPISLFKAVEKIDVGEKSFRCDALSIRRIQVRHSSGKYLDITGNEEQWQATHPWKDRVDYHTHVQPLLHFIHNSKVIDTLPRREFRLTDLGMTEDFFEIELFDEESNSVEEFILGRSTPWHSIAADEAKTHLPTYFIRHKKSSKKDYIYLVSDTSLQLNEIFEQNFKQFRDHRPFSIFSSICQIRIMRKGTDMIIERTAAGQPWYLTKPLELRCDQDTVKQLITDLSLLSATTVEDSNNFPETLNPDETLEVGIRHFGEEQEVTLTVALPSDESALSALAKVSNRDPIFSLPLAPASDIDVSLSKLPTSLNDVRAKTMLSLNGQELQTLVIHSNNQPPTLLTRERGDTYQIVQPDGHHELEIETFSEFIKGLTIDKVTKFVSDAAVDLRPYGLDKPNLRIALVDYAKNQQRLHIARSPDDSLIYAHIAKSPIIWQISEETLSKLDRPSWDWRPKRLWNLPYTDITSIVSKHSEKEEFSVFYDFGSDAYSATKGQNDVTDQLNPNRARYYFEAISQLQSLRRLSPNHAKAKELLQNPDFTLKITVQEYDNEGEPSYDIDHWLKLARASKSKDNQFYYVTISGESDYFLFNTDTASILVTDLFSN